MLAYLLDDCAALGLVRVSLLLSPLPPSYLLTSPIICLCIFILYPITLVFYSTSSESLIKITIIQFSYDVSLLSLSMTSGLNLMRITVLGILCPSTGTLCAVTLAGYKKTKGKKRREVN